MRRPVLPVVLATPPLLLLALTPVGAPAVLAQQPTDVVERVTTAADGQEALDLVVDDPPALLVLDRMLPGPLDGLEVTRRVRSLPGRRPRVLLLTAQQEPEDVEAARDVGVDAFLGKPFRVPELMSLVADLLALGPADR